MTFLLQREPLDAHVVFGDGQGFLLANRRFDCEGDRALGRAMHGATRANHVGVNDADDGGVGIIHKVNVSQPKQNARIFLKNYLVLKAVFSCVRARIAVGVIAFDPHHATTTLALLGDRLPLHGVVELHILVRFDVVVAEVIVVVVHDPSIAQFPRNTRNFLENYFYFLHFYS